MLGNRLLRALRESELQTTSARANEAKRGELPPSSLPAVSGRQTTNHDRGTISIEHESTIELQLQAQDPKLTIFSTIRHSTLDMALVVWMSNIRGPLSEGRWGITEPIS